MAETPIDPEILRACRDRYAQIVQEDRERMEGMLLYSDFFRVPGPPPSWLERCRRFWARASELSVGVQVGFFKLRLMAGARWLSLRLNPFVWGIFRHDGSIQVGPLFLDWGDSHDCSWDD